MHLHRISGFGTFLLGIVSIASISPCLASDTQPSLVTKAAALESLAAHSPAWDRKIHGQSPRLYFSNEEWPRVLKEINSMPASRAALKTKFFEAMDRMLTEPVPVYRTPEQMVGRPDGSTTLYSAMEELWQRDVGNNIFALAVAARIKPDAPYRAKMHDLVMAAAGFETWGRHSGRMGNNSDLAIGHVGRGIAVAYDWHRDAFTHAERAQIRAVVAARLPSLLNGLYGNAYWAKSFEENHNHVSVAALGFCGVAFYDEIPGAPEWLAAARLNFQSVGRHIAADGSSVEGVSYWNYGISYILQYIEATRPVIDSADLYERPFFKNAAAYRLMAATPGLVGNLTWGDAVPRGWGTPHYIIYRLAAQYDDPVASWFADHLPPPRGTLDEYALNMLWARNAPESGVAPGTLDHRITVNDLVTTRSGWEADDYVLSIKAGYTNRNHSHLDAGALGLAFGDEWLLIAPGYGRGGGDSAFWDSSGPRWTYFSNATESHATLLVNGKNQRHDQNARGTITHFFSASKWNTTTVDLTQAYHDVTSLTREVLHRRGDYILVFDTAAAAQPVTVEWLAQFRNKADADSNGTLTTEGKNGRLRVTLLSPSATPAPRQPTVPNVDMKLATHLTYSAGQSGRDTRFIALLQPLTRAQSTPPLKARVVTFGPSGAQLEISGDGWTDYLAKSEKTEVLRISPPSDKTAVRVTANLAAIRTTPRGLESVLARAATSVELPGLSYASETPCDLFLQKNSDKNWTVTASRDVQRHLSVPAGTTLRFVIGSSPQP